MRVSSTVAQDVRRFSWLAVPFLGIVLAACGGGTSSVGPVYEGGPVVCDALESSSYTYTLDTGFDIDNPDIVPAPTGVSRGPPDTTFATNVEAEVEDGERISATITNGDGFSTTTFASIVADGGVYLQFGSRGWEKQPADRPLELIPYRILGLCNAIAPDLDLDSLTGTLDESIASQKFEIGSLVMDFPSRTRDLVGGDVDALIEVFDVTVWVALNGSYISKVELSGTGFYGDGTSLAFHLSYEISDVGGNVSVDPPI